MGRRAVAPCEKAACAIQKCLKDNSFQEEACLQEVRRLQDCCKNLNEAARAENVHCSISFETGRKK
eukprot:scaffold1401_cov330-Pavlova_lutheri.AAC.122